MIRIQDQNEQMNSFESSFAEKKVKGISISFLPVLKNLFENTQAIMLFEEKKYCCCNKKGVQVFILKFISLLISLHL